MAKKKVARKKGSVRNTAKQVPSGNGDGNSLDVREMMNWDMVFNAMTTQRQLTRELMDPRRDIDDECGYPRTENLTAEDFRTLYDRESVAKRVVDVWPKESWQVQPTVFEDDDPDNATEFETAWDEADDQLQGESWHDEEEGSGIWPYLLRADIHSGIGSYGLLLMGLDDGKQLNEPAERGRSKKLTFLRVFDQSLAQITSYENDLGNPRYGLPTSYLLTLNDLRDQSGDASSPPTMTQQVHWSRVIHVADNLGNSETFGVSRMRPNYNRLYDLRKLYGGSGEMYWRGAFPGISIETDPTFGGDVDVNKAETRDQLENYMNSLQRYLLLNGLTAKSLPVQVSDPTPQIDAQIQAICIELGIPKRIFTGSERGELASTQDQKAWHLRLKNRQNFYLTPRVIVPFVDRMIWLGVLPEPEATGGYKVVWPDLDAQTDDEKATVAVKKTEAMAKYVQGGVEALVAPAHYLTKVMGQTDEEALDILETAAEAEPLVEEVEPLVEEEDDETPEKTAEGDPGGGGGKSDRNERGGD